MRRENNPGLKILWIWTFGTAAVLVANVARTRIRDMEQRINSQDQTPDVAGTISDDNDSEEKP